MLITDLIGFLVVALTTIAFVNRYVAGVVLRLLKGRKFDETTDDFEPTVEVVIPMYNEGRGIVETLQSLTTQEYPAEKLRITVVDDRSSDDSYEHALCVARFSSGRVRVLQNDKNVGKRASIIRVVRETQAEIIVSVDSDVVVEPGAIRQLMRRFSGPEIAAVGGRVDVRNKHDNWLTRMQVVKYWYAYNFMKNLEWAFRRVMCLSGCLTAYRRSVLVELEPIVANRAILGVPIKYGEDRYLTRQIVRAGYYTTMTNEAVCRTFAPATLSAFFSQQLRWRRSNIVDYVGGLSHVWRLNPIIAIHFFSLFGLLIAYPVLVARSVVNGTIFDLIIKQAIAALIVGLIYRWKVRKLAPEERVSAVAFVPFVLVLPIVYALLTPVALFTLDSSSWETRNHDGDEGKDGDLPAAPLPAPKPQLVAAHRLPPYSIAAAERRAALRASFETRVP